MHYFTSGGHTVHWGLGNETQSLYVDNLIWITEQSGL